MTQPLFLPHDRPHGAPSLADALAGKADPDLVRIILTIAEASAPLTARLALAGLPGDPAKVVGTNETGDKQKALDLAAHEHILAALSGCAIATLVSEEAPHPIAMQAGGKYDLAIDPIDGSGSIGIGAPLGLLFAIFPAADSQLHHGRDIVAGGYISFGHSTDLGVTLGNGVLIATRDPRDDVFRVHDLRPAIPATTRMIACNASNRRHFPPGLVRYLDTAFAGGDVERGADVNMRWIAAAVGDVHRILLKGGVFLYPADDRPGYDKGHLRLLYEAFPIAFLIEQAGGTASDGTGAILDRTPVDIHEKTPLFFGASKEVARIEAHLKT